MVKLHHIHAAPQATRVQFDGDRAIATTWRGEGSASLATKREIARRLAVCWNVLEGIPTEALAEGILRDLFAAIDAGDLAAAQALVAKFDARVELTADGNAHACAACLSCEGEAG